MPCSPRLLLHLFIGTIVAGVVFAGILYYFSGISIAAYFPSISFCPFHAITGFNCPGCGMTRAFLAIGQLKFKEAFALNPFAFPLFTLMLAYLFCGRLPGWLANKWIVRLTLAGVFVFWIYRI